MWFLTFCMQRSLYLQTSVSVITHQKKISATDGYYEKFPQLSLLAKQDAEKKEDQGEEGGLGPALVKT